MPISQRKKSSQREEKLLMEDHTHVEEEGLLVASSRLLKIMCLQACVSAAAPIFTDTETEMHTLYRPHTP